MKETIGRYSILRRLGSGGMAEVFLASLSGDDGFEKRVALKRIHEELQLDPSYVRAFADEARLVAQLNHPNIVQVFSFENDGSASFLVMEYVEGLPLSRAVRLARGQEIELSPAAVIAVGVQVCEALAYAHEATAYDGSAMHIVHRDIKPANLMVTPQGQIKVTDFGVARAATHLHHTATGSGKGTLAYMAPEQLRQGGIGPEADIFALGVVLFELLSGHLLFELQDLAEFLERRKQGFRTVDVEEVRRILPELAPVLERALASEPADRYASAREMEAALRALPAFEGMEPLRHWVRHLALVAGTSDGVRQGGPPETIVPPPSESPKTNFLARAGAPAVLGLGVLLLMALMIWRPWEDTPLPEVQTDEAIVEVAASDVTPAPEPTPAVAPLEPVTPEPTPEPATPKPTPAPIVPTPTPTPTTEAVAAAPTPTGSGQLNVRVDPWGSIFIDDVVQDLEGSLQNHEVDLGTHTIRVVPNDGTPPESRAISLTEDGEHQKWSFRYVDGAWQVKTR
jgi:eukaryotic-like serine/threonine-protein kinase